MVVARATIHHHLTKCETSKAARGKRKSTPGTSSNRRSILWGWDPMRKFGAIKPVSASDFEAMEATGKDRIYFRGYVDEIDPRKLVITASGPEV